MALWRTHIKVAELIIERDKSLEGIDFLVGAIAPDCNHENEDFTSFVPPKEATHFMDGKTKYTTNLERYAEKHLHSFKTKEEKNFYLGYLCHLVADLEFQKFIRDEKRVANIYKRIESRGLIGEFANLPRDFDSVKKIFGKKRLMSELEHLERKSVNDYYWSQITNITSYQNPMEIFENNSIERKVPIMTVFFGKEVDDLILFSEEEYSFFLEKAVDTYFEFLGGQNID